MLTSAYRLLLAISRAFFTGRRTVLWEDERKVMAVEIGSAGTWPRQRIPSSSSVTSSSLVELDEGIPKRTVRFQCGLFREVETFIGNDVKILCRETLLEYVCDLLTLRFPEHPYGDLSSKVTLKKHNKDDSLSPLEDSDEIEDGCLVEIILKATAKQEVESNICAHILQVQSYKGPTFCDYCGKIMIGLVKQGLKCEGCGLNCHKGCAIRIPNNCSRSKTSSETTGVGTFSRKSKKEMWSGRPLWVDRAMRDKPQLPHTFAVKTYTTLTVCHHCKKLLKGLFRQGVQCKDCGINCHRKCAKESVIGRNCMGEMGLDYQSGDSSVLGTLPRFGMVSSAENSLLEEHEKEERELEKTISSEGSQSSVTSQDLHQTGMVVEVIKESHLKPNGLMPAVIEEREPSNSSDTASSREKIAEEVESGTYIPLQRVIVTMQYSKQNNATVLMEGWMVHYTQRNPVRKKYYWLLDTKCLTMYTSDDKTQAHQEIQLSEMLAVDPPVSDTSLYLLSPMHVFEIVTSDSNFFCGIDLDGGASVTDIQVFPQGFIVDQNIPNILKKFKDQSPQALEKIGIGLTVGVEWGEALHSALMPMTPAMSLSSLSDVGGPSVPLPGYHNSFKSSHRSSKRGSLRGSIHRNQRNSMYNTQRTHGNSFHHKGSYYGVQRLNTPQDSSQVQRTPQGSVYGRVKGSLRGSFRVPKSSEQPPGLEKPPGLSLVGELKPVVETSMDISLFYQIYPDNILGSGQFGTVYGGVHRTTSHPVAVKVIDKLRFPNKHESALKHEVAILQHLSHPGIVTLEQMFETPEKIYVVMEKMHGDMLELILSSPESKLSEQQTKFFVYQILTALQYLHSKDVVHCDLKPENVLLASREYLPQIKLCDFGFARIIGENHFRKSIVGTPAYLAPEVLKNQGYNRSLDLWSVGVIIYVSLSGTFPFNEDEEIADQIQNAAFMFPPDPWNSVSRDAVDLINRLLQVEKRKRYQVSKALNHPWLQSRQTYDDLRACEKKAGTRYLTHEAQDKYWQSTDGGKGSTSPLLHMARPIATPSSGMNGVTREQEPLSPRKSALEKDDTEVARTEARAKRIGYQVSAV